jgi:glutaredoxin
MKKVLYFYLAGCPFCRQADRWMEEVVREHPEYAAVEVRAVEERREREFARGFDYYFVPTFYVDGIKEHEGVATKAVVESVFKKAME